MSRVWLFATPWIVARQASLSVGFSMQEYWSGLPFLSPWDLPDPGVKPGSLALQADSSPPAPPGKPAGPLMGACWSLSHIQLFTLLCTVAHLAPLSMGLPQQESWSGLPFPSPGDLPNPRIKRASLVFCLGRQTLFKHCLCTHSFFEVPGCGCAQALLWLWWAGLLSSCGVWPSHCGGSLAVEWGPGARGLRQLVAAPGP